MLQWLEEDSSSGGGVSLGAHDSIKLLGGTDAAPGTALCDKAEDTR